MLFLLEDGNTIMEDHGFDLKDILPPGVIPTFKSAKETEELPALHQ